MSKKTLAEKMQELGVPKSWILELRALEIERDRAMERAEEYGLIIDSLMEREGKSD